MMVAGTGNVIGVTKEGVLVLFQPTTPEVSFIAPAPTIKTPKIMAGTKVQVVITEI